MILRTGFLIVAQKLQEAADSLHHNDVRSRLSDTINDFHRGTGNWGSLVDYNGDGESGDVIYTSGGDMRRAPYEMSTANGAQSTKIDFENSENVMPHTTYEPEADEDDDMSTMVESMKAEGLYTELPLYERFISKAERDKADSSDFAGKGKSFPILKPEDVMAAVRSMGRAGSSNLGPSGLKARIIAIAKRKGWTKYLPKAWRDGGSTESSESYASPYHGRLGTAKQFREALNSRGDALEPSVRRILGKVLSEDDRDADAFLSWLGRESYLSSSTANGQRRDSGASGQHGNSGSRDSRASRESDTQARGQRNGIVSHENSQEHSISLTESACTLDEIKLVEARADYEIKLIAPGKGSSAFYPKEVLQRDGPKVFKAGTHVYLNHPTAAEEAARPEGDVNNLAGVLSTGATYQESHPKGPGLYARMKVFADHAATVEEKAPHVGMSIRASGVAEAGRMKEGVPVLRELVHAESVDVVTRAGAGGMILSESAHDATKEGAAENMTAEEAKKLIEAEVRPFKVRALRGDAREEAQRLLESAELPKAAKDRIIETVLRDVPEKSGELDLGKFRESVVAATKSEGAYLASLTGSGVVRGMGSAPVQLTDEQVEAREKAEKRARKDAVAIFESMGMPKDAAKSAAEGRAH